MAKLNVAAGFITLGSAVAEIRRGSLRESASVVRGKAVGDLVAQKDCIAVEYSGEIEVYSTAAAASPFVAKVGDTGTLVYKDQKAVPGTLFNGAVIVTAVGDRQSAGDYQTQTLGWESNGEPTTP